jgi:PPOX class probable F420-dependent enzyme
MTKESGLDQAPSGYFAPLAGAKYVLLNTFKRDGTAVGTPVNIVVVADTAFFRTWDVSGKAKRLRHTAAVDIAPSTFRGRPLGPSIRADAQLLAGVGSEHAASLLAEKHPFLHGRFIPWYHRRRGWTTQQYRLTPPENGPRSEVGPGAPSP